MCNTSGQAFVERHATPDRVRNGRVLEVGAYDVNGTVRPVLTALAPARYVGVDIAPGPGVDEVVSVYDLVSHFGGGTFDVVVSTEMLEHVADWRRAIDQLKGVLSRDGLLIVTTRSPGFGYHGYPADYWRFTTKDFARIFTDMEIEGLESDSASPGVFLAALKLEGTPTPLAGLRIHSVLSGRPARSVPRFAGPRARAITLWQDTGPRRRRAVRLVRRRLRRLLGRQ